MPFEVQPCPPALRRKALTVLYRRLPETLRPSLIDEVLADAEADRVDLLGLWVAHNRGRVHGALMVQTLAGRAAGLWAPEVETFWGRRKLAATLVQAAVNDLRARGFLVVQALVDLRASHPAAGDLVRGGLKRVTVLTYMGRPTSEPLNLDPKLPRFDWQPYSAATDPEFREVLRNTYIGSRDMPELEGARSLDDVLASHRAGGRFDPSRWRVGRLPGEPKASAILLLADQGERTAWEVAYLGLTPPARGRGLGRAALAHALDLARPFATRLELAVDARNDPARRLYLTTGFVPHDRRAVYLARLKDRGAG